MALQYRRTAFIHGDVARFYNPETIGQKQFAQFFLQPPPPPPFNSSMSMRGPVIFSSEFKSVMEWRSLEDSQESAMRVVGHVRK